MTPGEAHADLLAEIAALREHVASQDRRIAELQGALGQASDQQTATSEILRVISSSRTDVQPVFDAIVENALPLCGAHFTAVHPFDGELVHPAAAMRNFDPVGAEAMTKQFPMKPTLPSTTGRAILNRRPSYVRDVRDDPAYVGTPLGEAARIAGFVSIVAVPMLRDGQPIGTINAAAGQPDAFSEQQIALLQTFANQAVIAIENVRLFTELQEKNRALTALVEIRELKDRLQRENIVLREEIDKTSMFDEIVGSSPSLKTVLSQVSKVAPTDSTVLITGETGTGKELVARAIHKRSPRASRTFVGVNCAAIPASLIASELFGHEKGAFTGAVQRRQGRFELADGGTIFLDEVGELPTETQIMLLRVLQEHEFERVGGTGPIRVHARVIAATNRDLGAAVADGTFRADLFYRLNVFPLDVPSLRDRRSDIPMLVEYFIHRYAKRAGKRICGLAKETSQLLQSYDWPGNIRELQNVIERAVILADSDNLSIDPQWLFSPSMTPPAVASTPPATLTASEKDAIEAALRESQGRVAGPFGAAARLGVPSSTLESKIKALNIDKRRFKST